MEILTSVLTSAIITAVFGGVIAYQNAKYNRGRQSRRDEIGVLQGTVKELRKDRDDAKREIRHLRDEHTACLIAQERMQGTIARLCDKLGIKVSEVECGESPDS